MELVIIIPAGILVSIASGLLSAASVKGAICESITGLKEEVKLLRGSLEGAGGLRERVTRLEEK